MPDSTSSDLTHPAERQQEMPLRRGLFGYRRRDVDEAMARLNERVNVLEGQAVDLRQEIMEERDSSSEVRHELSRVRAELRYWNDRASFVDGEVARARQRAAEIEEAARHRGQTIEADAQERALQLIDRVAAEANSMLQMAREEANNMFRRFETDVDLSHQKLDKLEQVRREVAETMQGALGKFEEAIRDLDKADSSRRLVASVDEEPRRVSTPTFGKQKAVEAARRFEDAYTAGATDAVSVLTTDDPIVAVDPAAGDEQVRVDSPVTGVRLVSLLDQT